MTIDEEGNGEDGRAEAGCGEGDPRDRRRRVRAGAGGAHFDALTFPLSTGEEEFFRSAVETIEGIRAIEEALPGVSTILGISNVSFGLNPVARKIVNAVFLYHAVKAGLDLAIVHPSHVVPYAEIPGEERLLAEDLVLARRPDALARLIDFFEGRVDTGEEGGPDPMAGMAVAERLHYRILTGRRTGSRPTSTRRSPPTTRSRC
jgi:5-methyltetrahydrofolate--homocysteine methyltransferase